MVTYSIRAERIPEQVVPGKRLGRNLRHDTRSLAYPFDASGITLQTVLHTRHTPILAQLGGSCTGNAMAGALATDPVYGYGALPPGIHLDEQEALSLYSAAEIIDGGAGLPSEDDGSSGVSVCQAAKNAGLISGYTHCFSLNAALAAIVNGPVLFGIDWFDSFDQPASDGEVTISPAATVRGGHEVVARGIDVSTQLIRLDNSWGPDWGDAGSFSVGWGTMERLLAEEGDAAVPLPLSVGPPVPVPVADPDVAYCTDPRLLAWSVSGHTGGNKYAAAQYRALRKAKGY